MSRSEDWDKNEKGPRDSKFDKKLEKFSMKLYTLYKKILPRALVKLDQKLSNYIQKHGIKLSIRQYWLSIFCIHLVCWIFLPYLLGHIKTGVIAVSGTEFTLDGLIRLPILVASLFLYFAIDKDDDGDEKKDEPPEDDDGIKIPINTKENSK